MNENVAECRDWEGSRATRKADERTRSDAIARPYIVAWIPLPTAPLQNPICHNQSATICSAESPASHRDALNREIRQCAEMCRNVQYRLISSFFSSTARAHPHQHCPHNSGENVTKCHDALPDANVNRQRNTLPESAKKIDETLRKSTES